MRLLAAACPPGPTASSTTVVSPSEAPYTAAASPAGPAPTTVRSTKPPESSPRYDSPSVCASSPGVARLRTRSGSSAAGRSALVSDAASINDCPATESASNQRCGSRRLAACAKRERGRIHRAADELESSGGAVLYEHSTPSAEGLEEDVGQLGVLGHQPAEALGRDPVN